MRPEPSDRCTHPDDEWCDDCFIPARHLSALHALDADARPEPPDPAEDPAPVRPFHWTAADIACWQVALTGGENGHTPNVTIDPMGPLPRIAGQEPAIDLDAMLTRYRAAVDRDPFPRVLSSPAYDWATEGCVNRRHNHGDRAYKETCLDTSVPPYPFIHRATGAVAVAGFVGLAAALALGWKIGERLAALRQDAHDLWCETLG